MSQMRKPGLSTFLNASSGAEIARQMSQEPLITQAMGGLFVEKADLHEIEYILDLYCGPGSWALEMAFYHPEVEIIAIDSNQYMIEYARAQAKVQGLENIHFIVMDARQGLDFPDNTFDIINARFISTFLSTEDWPVLISEFVRVCKSQGIIRLTESDEPFISNSAACEYLKQLYNQALSLNQQSFHPLNGASSCCITPQLRGFLSDNGCEQIQERASVISYGFDTPNAYLKYDNLKVLFKLGQPFLCERGVATQSELDRLYDEMLIDIVTGNFRAVWYFLTCWGYVK
jgi:ubiquinone/menaquinone biosynthesis C-methylase UbiE